MLAFIFPGQGSQIKGMGEELFDTVPDYKIVEPFVDEILGYSLREKCLQDPDEELGQTHFTQPCLYTVNALHTCKAIEDGHRPNILAGHSLGEFNALLTAGAFDFLTGLKMVQKRGELMSKQKNGGMMAVIDLSVESVEKVLAEERYREIELANINSPSQIVISGHVDQLDLVQNDLMSAGAKVCIPLPVSAAFHSSKMQDIAEEFRQFLSQFQFKTLKVPVIANISATPYETTDPKQCISNTLVKQISSSVKWQQTIQYLKINGVTEFKEIGPGNVLTRLNQQILSD